MQPIARGTKLAVELLRALVREPERTVRLLENLPFALRGRRASLGDGGRASRGANGVGSADGADESLGRLRRYFEEHHEGPGIWKWLHYFELYERHFSHFVGREVNVLEIGIYSGGSLGMWRDYFGPGCHIYGVDIEPACRAYAGERTDVFIGDQADRGFWRELRGQTPQFDIVIDDGGHLPEQQIVTLEEVLPHVKPGGVYLCEDVGGEFNAFSAYARNLSERLNRDEPLSRSATGELSVETNAFQAAIHSVHFYPFVCVIEKRARALESLTAPRHGTSWEPFLG